MEFEYEGTVDLGGEMKERVESIDLENSMDLRKYRDLIWWKVEAHSVESVELREPVEWNE